MKVLVIGGRGDADVARPYKGQVGRALLRRGRRDHHVLPMSHAGIDVTDVEQLHTRLAVFARPGGPLAWDVVNNCAAYTAVDKAESERDAAFAVNATGAGNVARACAELGVPLIHISTDYVFDGTSTRPYREDDPPAPLGVYGASKLAGEAEVLAAGGTVVRTSWVFSRDCASFVRTIAIAAVTKPQLRVVDDQLGCPTYADDLADALLQLAERVVRGEPLARIYHACNAEPVTWCGFARAIVAEARAHRAIACTEVAAITTAEYPTAARRPAYSVLDTSRLAALGIALPAWRPGLATAVRDLLEHDVQLAFADRARAEGRA
jgi:dTDP-4-dehydrorhamnose reductase